MNYSPSAFDQFQSKIAHEFGEGSAIDPELRDANVQIVADLEILPGGEVTTPIHDALNWKTTRFGRQSRPTLYAALLVDEKGEVWQAKLSKPNTDDKKGKVRKYEAPVGKGSRAFLPRVPDLIRQKISKRYGCNVPSEAEGSFWDWLEEHSKIPIVITEGAKKALALQSQGYVAIALYGVNGGYRVKDEHGQECDPYLIKDLFRFVVDEHRVANERRITLAFDQDVKPETRRKVERALSKFGRLLEKFKCKVPIAQWKPEQGKGVDDLIVNCGAAAWDEAYAGAVPSGERFEAETKKIQHELNNLRIAPTIEASGRYIPSGLLQLPDRSGILIVDAPMGTGKTSTALKEVVQQHRSQYPKALRSLFVPRNLLGLQAGFTLGLPHHRNRSSFGSLQEVTLCVESIGILSPDSLPQDRPLLLFDEISQTLKQILEGSTCRNSQVFVLNRLRGILRWVAERGGWIVLSEDGVTNLELDFISEASGLEVADFFKFTRTGQKPRDYVMCNSAAETWVELEDRLRNGENVVLASDSARWLRDTERKALALGIAPEQIKIIDGDSSEEPWAKNFAANPDAWIIREKPRILGFSPSLNSGVSILDTTNHFSAVGLHLVHLEPRAAKQLPDRLRTDVPRFGYVKVRGTTEDDLFSGSRPEQIVSDIYRSTEEVNRLTQFAEYAVQQAPTDIDGRALDLIGVMDEIRNSKGDSSSEYGFWLKHWSRYKAREHHARLSLRSELIDIWEQQGHKVEFLPEDEDSKKRQQRISANKEQRKEIRKQLDREESETYAETDTSHLTLNAARGILNDLGSTKDDRRTARKRLLQDKLPGCNLDSAEFVLKSVVKDYGRFLRTTELLWACQNPEAAKQLDRWSWLGAHTQAAKQREIVWLPRLPVRSAQAALMSTCPLQPFIDGKVAGWDDSAPEAIKVHQWALMHRHRFRRYLRLTISEDHSPTQTVNKLLKKLGFEVKSVSRKGSRKDRQRQYSIKNLQDADRDAILKALTERFLQRAEEKGEQPKEDAPVHVATVATMRVAETNTPPETEWQTGEALADIRAWWESAADSPEIRAEISRIVPRDILTRAIA